MQRYTVVTLFPELIDAFRNVGVVQRACVREIVSIETLNPRAYSDDKRGTVDDTPYGGGPGMVMKAKPLRRAIMHAKTSHPDSPAHVIYLSPQGRRLDQSGFVELAGYEYLILVAGRYEGVDERVISREVDEEWSLGDFVLTGGETAAMVLLDGVIRLLPGVVGDANSVAQDSFSTGLLDHAHYTRPEVVDGDAVPAVLISGDHAAVARWRRRDAVRRTWLRRPDLLASARLTADDKHYLAELSAAESRRDGSASADKDEA